MSISEEKFQQLEQRVENLESRLEESPESLNQIDSLRGLVEDADPSNYHERAIVVGYFLEQESNGFTMEDIQEGFQRCKIPRYSNPRELKRQLLKEKKHFMEAPEDNDKFVLTSKAEKQVKEMISDES